MPRFVVEHTHPAERCPAGNPAVASGLLAIVSPGNAKKQGITIHGEGVANGRHHLYVIVDGPSEEAVRRYFAPFGQMGTLDLLGASACEEVVEHGHC
jgi:hypothetical protein